jgi:hypothetical protein
VIFLKRFLILLVLVSLFVFGCKGSDTTATTTDTPSSTPTQTTPATPPATTPPATGTQTATDAGGTPDESILIGNWVLDQSTSDPQAFEIMRQEFAKAVPDVPLNDIVYNFNATTCSILYGTEVAEQYRAKYSSDGSGGWYVDCIDSGSPVYYFQFHGDNSVELSNEQKLPTRLLFIRKQ